MSNKTIGIIYAIISAVVGLLTLFVDGIILGVVSITFFYLLSAFLLTNFHGMNFDNPFLWIYELIKGE